jgi:hypothetical protein
MIDRLVTDICHVMEQLMVCTYLLEFVLELLTDTTPEYKRNGPRSIPIVEPQCGEDACIPWTSGPQPTQG